MLNHPIDGKRSCEKKLIGEFPQFVHEQHVTSPPTANLIPFRKKLS
jgi:hypothetical protein